MRSLGIDYGDARVGIAISDELNITAQGLETIHHKGNDKIVLYVAKTERVNKKTKYYVTFLFFERQNDKWVKTSVVELPDDNHNKSRYGQLIPLNENTLIWNGSLGLYRISYE